MLVSLFGFADSANTKGTVKITSDRTIFAMARTYNQAASGTFGQYYPALVAAQAMTNGQSAVLPLLKKSADFRANTGFQNLGAASCTGTVKLFNASGVQVGSTRTLTAATDKYIQEDDVFAKAGAGNQQPAYALVEVTTAAGQAVVLRLRHRRRHQRPHHHSAAAVGSGSAGDPGGSSARWGEGAEFTSAPRGGRETSPPETAPTRFLGGPAARQGRRRGGVKAPNSLPAPRGGRETSPPRDGQSL